MGKLLSVGSNVSVFCVKRQMKALGQSEKGCQGPCVVQMESDNLFVSLKEPKECRLGKYLKRPSAPVAAPSLQVEEEKERLCFVTPFFMLLRTFVSG